MMKNQTFLASCLIALVATLVQAELRLGTPFSDHMVLQRDREISVWGWDTPNTSITVRLGDQTAATSVTAEGKWLVKLAAPSIGEPESLMVEGTSRITLQDVLVGEVWLCSGQSNMEWPVIASLNAEQETSVANHPHIRHIKIPHTPSAIPQEHVATEGWRVCSPDSVAKFSAVGYYFGRHLQTRLDVPIGLISSNWGGTRIEPWVSPEGFKQVATLTEISGNLANFPKSNVDGSVNHQSAMALYNGMIHPLSPYSIRGTIWYQGESNIGEAMVYRDKMAALIAGWRFVWQDARMPFYFVQLAPFRKDGDPSRLPGIWEAQLATLSVPNTGMAVTTDIGNLADIHPKNKQDVGKRLALWALAKTYGLDVPSYSGPLYRSMKIESGRIRIFFDHADDGLVARDGKSLTWFTIAGDNKVFVDAEALIDGSTVVVQSELVAKPLAVRFGWHQEAEPNLTNKAGLPASPFRTISW